MNKHWHSTVPLLLGGNYYNLFFLNLKLEPQFAIYFVKLYPPKCNCFWPKYRHQGPTLLTKRESYQSGWWFTVPLTCKCFHHVYSHQWIGLTENEKGTFKGASLQWPLCKLQILPPSSQMAMYGSIVSPAHWTWERYLCRYSCTVAPTAPASFSTI